MFGLQGHDWQDLCREPLDIATYQTYKLLTSWFQIFPHYKSIEMFDPLGGASLNPRGLIGMIYVENH